MTGEIDPSNARQLRACLAECLGAGCSHVVVDLAELSFIDSSGLSVLAFAARQLRARDGRLVSSNPWSMVLKVIDISGLASASEVTVSGPQ